MAIGFTGRAIVPFFDCISQLLCKPLLLRRTARRAFATPKRDGDVQRWDSSLFTCFSCDLDYSIAEGDYLWHRIATRRAACLDKLSMFDSDDNTFVSYDEIRLATMVWIGFGKLLTEFTREELPEQVKVPLLHRFLALASHIRGRVAFCVYS